MKGKLESAPYNFRPTSVLPVLSTIIERHYNDSLYDFLNENNLIYSSQSEFRRKHGTETSLIKIIDKLLFNLDKDRVSGIALVDYRKAFDIVDHELLLRKFKVYGVANEELNWCRSFLCSRKQVVHVRGKESGEAILRYGVPQGSIIGPLFRKYSPNSRCRPPSCLLAVFAIFLAIISPSSSCSS